jgi:hypothetical protein
MLFKWKAGQMSRRVFDRGSEGHSRCLLVAQKGATVTMCSFRTHTAFAYTSGGANPSGEFYNPLERLTRSWEPHNKVPSSRRSLLKWGRFQRMKPPISIYSFLLCTILCNSPDISLQNDQFHYQKLNYFSPNCNGNFILSSGSQVW